MHNRGVEQARAIAWASRERGCLGRRRRGGRSSQGDAAEGGESRLGLLTRNRDEGGREGEKGRVDERHGDQCARYGGQQGSKSARE